MIKSKRLQVIVSYLNQEDKIIDIGCDHAYVMIEMALKGCQTLLASDIHEKALEIAKKNIREADVFVETKLSDGLRNVETKNYDTVVIAGMGENTIEHILNETEKLNPIQKLILQSNNDLPALRKYIETIGFYIEDETVVFEANHYYTVMLCYRGGKKLSQEELEFGIYKKENLEYYSYRKNKLENIRRKVPDLKKEFFSKQIESLEHYLKERTQDY